MTDDPNQPVPLTSAPTEFKATAIARALEDRGIPARVIGALTTGFRAEAPGESTVTVLHKDLERARAALKSMAAEAGEIDWSQVDVGPHPDAPMHTPAPSSAAPLPSPSAAQSERRWAWTLVLVVLIPVGGILTVVGQQYAADPVIRAVGPIIIGVAAVMVLWLVSTGGGGDRGEAD